MSKRAYEIKPAISDEFARFLWATAPRYHELRAIVQRARRWRHPRLWRWFKVINIAMSVVVLVALACLILAWLGELTEEPIRRATTAVWVFIGLLLVLNVGRRVADDRELRRSVHRLPRWYARRPRAMGLGKEDARLIEKARLARDPLVAWRAIRERVPTRESGYDRLIGAELRWMCSGRNGWAWYVVASALLVAFLSIVIVEPFDVDPIIKDTLIESVIFGVLIIVIIAAFAQRSAKKALVRMACAVGMTLADRCANCDYVLKGLPPTYNAALDVMEVTCPECGLAHRCESR